MAIFTFDIQLCANMLFIHFSMYKEAFLTVITHHIAGGDGDVCVINLIESSIIEVFIYGLLFQ
jgi:hypothetical protein